MNRAHTYKMERFGSGASKKRGGLGWREAVLGGVARGKCGRRTVGLWRIFRRCLEGRVGCVFGVAGKGMLGVIELQQSPPKDLKVRFFCFYVFLLLLLFQNPFDLYIEEIVSPEVPW